MNVCREKAMPFLYLGNLFCTTVLMINRLTILPFTQFNRHYLYLNWQCRSGLSQNFSVQSRCHFGMSRSDSMQSRSHFDVLRSHSMESRSHFDVSLNESDLSLSDFVQNMKSIRGAADWFCSRCNSPVFTNISDVM